MERQDERGRWTRLTGSGETKRWGRILRIEIGWLWRAAGFLLLFLMPFFSYVVFETITGNLQYIWKERELLNVLWIAVFYFLVFAVSGSSRIGVPVVSLLLFILAVAEALVEEFRGTPIMVWDLLAVETAVTVAENYVIQLTDEMREAGILLLCLNLLVMICPAQLRWWKEWLIGGIGFAGMAVAFICYFYMWIVPGQMLEINMWEMNDTYQHQGYVLVTMISLKYIVKKPPQGYSTARLQEICERVQGREKVGEDEREIEASGGETAGILGESIVGMWNGEVEGILDKVEGEIASEGLDKGKDEIELEGSDKGKDEIMLEGSDKGKDEITSEELNKGKDEIVSEGSAGVREEILARLRVRIPTEGKNEMPSEKRADASAEVRNEILAGLKVRIPVETEGGILDKGTAGVKDEGKSGTRSKTENGIQPVNLICIMNESLSDLRVVGDFNTNRECFPYLDRLRRNTVRGSLCMPVFGAWTSNSEFEFLTGDSMALLPSASIAYQFYVKPETYSMVSTLKDQGYRAVAMHPYPSENWNRDKCYPNLGFDEFVAGDDYEGCETIRNYVSDRADYQKIIEMVEQKEDPEDKLFVFNVTMQNHGGYEGTYDNFQEDVWLTGNLKGKYPKTDQYLSLVRRSDVAFWGLLQYFTLSDEPTMIVMFGDHQPSVEDEFFDEIYGVPSGNVPVGERLMWYETPFVIWTNYEQPEQDMGRLGAVFLSSHVLQLANLELTIYNRFLLNMSEKISVVHPIGCYEKDGTFYSWEEARSEACPYRQLIEDYECLVYNHSLDGKGKRMEKLFVVGKP